MSVTINDIAKASGLSTATISRVLSGKGNVKKETADLVMKYVEELGYKYKNSSKKDPSRDIKIMAIAGDIRNQFYLGIIQGANNVFIKNGYKMAIFNSNNDPVTEEEFVNFAHQDQYDGIIMITATETVTLTELLKKNLCPVVLVNRYIRSMDLDAVLIDNSRGGYIATQYLIQKGHTRIAHLSGPDNSTASQDRKQGYLAALKDSKIHSEKKAVFEGNLKKESGIAFADYFVNNLSGYTAVFCANDIMAAAFVERLYELGYQVPRDVSVICFDDTPAATHGRIKLTTVYCDPETMGEVAASILVENLSNDTSFKRKVIYPPELIERESVADISK
ncbi:MAG: LacI family transcriptional regulator [Clostridiaceae bacterium]|nr:LacI family transcriptional regulator [Clostridiaceae bacterium]